MQSSKTQLKSLYDSLKAKHSNVSVIFMNYANRYFFYLGVLSSTDGHSLIRDVLFCFERGSLFMKNTESPDEPSGHVNILIYSIKRDRTLLRCIKSNYGLTVLSRGHRKRRKSHLCGPNEMHVPFICVSA